MAKILLVDDDELVIYALSKFLCKSGHMVVEASNGLEAMENLNQYSFDILVTDLLMPEVEGFELIKYTQKNHPNLPVIVMSGGGRMSDIIFPPGAELIGTYAILEKPFEEKYLLKLIEEKMQV